MGGEPAGDGERPTGDPDVVDRPYERRYVIRSKGAVVGAAHYRRVRDRVVFTHTEVDPTAGGHGFGSQLVRAALDDVRRQGLEVVPLCPFVASFIRHHPDYADLVDERHRQRTEAEDTPTS